MKIRPLHDRVIVKRMEEERTSPGGIVIPDAATEKPIKGEIIAVGNGKVLDSGDIRKLDVKAGDTVTLKPRERVQVLLINKSLGDSDKQGVWWILVVKVGF